MVIAACSVAVNQWLWLMLIGIVVVIAACSVAVSPWLWLLLIGSCGYCCLFGSCKPMAMVDVNW